MLSSPLPNILYPLASASSASQTSTSENQLISAFLSSPDLNGYRAQSTLISETTTPTPSFISQLLEGIDTECRETLILAPPFRSLDITRPSPIHAKDIISEMKKLQIETLKLIEKINFSKNYEKDESSKLNNTDIQLFSLNLKKILDLYFLTQTDKENIAPLQIIEDTLSALEKKVLMQTLAFRENQLEKYKKLESEKLGKSSMQNSFENDNIIKLEIFRIEMHIKAIKSSKPYGQIFPRYFVELSSFLNINQKDSYDSDNLEKQTNEEKLCTTLERFFKERKSTKKKL